MDDIDMNDQQPTSRRTGVAIEIRGDWEWVEDGPWNHRTKRTDPDGTVTTTTDPDGTVTTTTEIGGVVTTVVTESPGGIMPRKYRKGAT